MKNGHLVTWKPAGWGFLRSGDGQPDTFCHRFDFEDCEPVQGRLYFREIVATAGARHFRRCDVPMIAQLASAQCIAAHFAGRVGHESDAFRHWESAVKIVNTLSRSLRLTPQSRYCSREAERSTRTPDGPAPWDVSHWDGDEVKRSVKDPL